MARAALRRLTIVMVAVGAIGGLAGVAYVGLADGQEAPPTAATATTELPPLPAWPDGPNCPVRVDEVPPVLPPEGVVLISEFILRPQPATPGLISGADAVTAAHEYENNPDMRIESVSLASYTPEGSDPLCPNPNFGDTLHLHDIPAWVVVYKAPYAFDARVGGYVQPGAVTIPPNLSTRIVEIVSAENGAHIVGFELP